MTPAWFLPKATLLARLFNSSITVNTGNNTEAILNLITVSLFSM